MTAGAPWSVKGIDPKAREVAKDLARRSGMTLGEWLNRAILDGDSPDGGMGEPAYEPVYASRHAAYDTRFAPIQSPAQDFGRVAQALDRLSDRIEASEARTGLAVSGVEQSVRQALARVETTEREHAALLDRLARLEAEPAGPRSAEALRILEDRILTIEAGERRAAQAMEQMGRQVLAMAEAVNRRLQAAERQSAAAFDNVGGEVARIAGAVEARLSRAESAQAESLERFGAEIHRLTDRFSERLVVAERRSAQAIDDVGQQVARVTERIEQRHERAAGDLAERIRQSEERTARMLEEARAKLLGRATAAEAGPIAAAEPRPEPAIEPPPPPLDEIEPPRGPFGPELFSRAEPLAEAAVDPARPSFAAEDFEAAEGFAPLAELEEEDEVFDLDAPAQAAAQADVDPAAAARPLSTREVIDQARAAARAAQAAVEAEAARPAEFRAKVDRRQATGRMFAGFGAARPRRHNGAVHTALMVAGGAAFLSVGAAGVVLMNGPQAEPEQLRAEAQAIGAPRAAVALAPEAASAQAPAVTPAAVDPELPGRFAEALKLTEARKAGGLAKLKAVADDGYAPAQFYLAQLYETGRLGVVQNLGEARRWTARAAEAGEPNAMHNLGLYFFQGDGGPQDLASAAQWFRKAAELGVIDSQYNLGLMYQAGSGVQKDPAEALKWFDQAAAQGDGLARAAAAGLKAQLAQGAARPPQG